LLCTEDDNSCYRNVCKMSVVSFALAIVFIIREHRCSIDFIDFAHFMVVVAKFHLWRGGTQHFHSNVYDNWDYHRKALQCAHLCCTEFTVS